MSDYAIIQVAQTLGPGLIAIGVGAIVLGVGIAIRGLAGGSRKQLNDLTERLLSTEDRVRRLAGLIRELDTERGRDIEGKRSAELPPADQRG